MENLNKIIVFSIILSLLIIIPTGFAAESSVDFADDNLANGNILSDNSIDEDSFSLSLSNEDNLNAVENNDLINDDEPANGNINEYYFDSNALDDNGNGSIDNPYKTLNDERILSNSILHFASGVYNYTPNGYYYHDNITFYGQDSANTIIYNPFIDSVSSLNKTHVKSEINIFYDWIRIILNYIRW